MGRIASRKSRQRFRKREIIVNVQGDEPMISPQTIEKAVEVMAAEMSKPEAAPELSRPGNQSSQTAICSIPTW